MAAALVQEPPGTASAQLPEATSTQSTSKLPPSTTAAQPKSTVSLSSPPVTSPAPLTTTQAPVTTTRAPVTPPEVVIFNGTCVLVQMAAQLNFTYNTTGKLLHYKNGLV